MKNRFNKIAEILQDYSLGNFNKKLSLSPKLDEIDAFMAGINMLGEELRETTISKNYFTNIFDSIGEMVFVVNKKGIITNHNKSVTDYFKCKAADLNNKSLDDFLELNDFFLFKQLTSQLKERSGYSEMEISVELKFHKKVYLLLTITNLINRNSKITGFIITAKDISLQKETNNIVIRTIVETEEKERLRVAQDIHDSVGQQLSSLKFYLGSSRDLVQNKEVKDILTKANNALIAVQSEMRNICFNLMPKSLEVMGLLPAIKELCLQINLNTHLQFDIKGRTAFSNLPKPLEIALFRIIQEFINNSLKHARAFRVSIHFTFKRPNLLITLIDDGVGFNVRNAKTKGMGLRNIQSRVTAYKGNVDISSTIGVGINFKITIPLID